MEEVVLATGVVVPRMHTSRYDDDNEVLRWIDQYGSYIPSSDGAPDSKNIKWFVYELKNNLI